MLRLQTILHPTDFSEQSHYAFRLACSLARDHGARVLVMHVWSLPPSAIAAGVPASLRPEEYYPEGLDQQLRQIHAADPAVHVDHRLEEGDPADEIMRVARESACDLIVMGTHGRTGFSRLLFGSVAEQVVRRASCPVLTVKTPWAEPVAEAAHHAEEVLHAS